MNGLDSILNEYRLCELYCNGLVDILTLPSYYSVGREDKHIVHVYHVLLYRTAIHDKYRIESYRCITLAGLVSKYGGECHHSVIIRPCVLDF